MRIGISCFGHKPGTAGGTQVYRRELISALASFDRSHQYILLKWEDDNIALDDLPSNFTSVALSCSTKGFLSSRLEQVAVNYFLWNRPNVLSRQVDGLALDLIHFPTTVISPVIHAVPVVLTFFDMQQEFYPENFSAMERLRRRLTYRPSAQWAAVIISPSTFTTETLVQRYHIARHKIRQVPAGILYPANVWPHKNHRRLLAALVRLNTMYGLRLNLVCTGARWRAGETLTQMARSAGLLEQQFFDLGFVRAEDMLPIYCATRLMVFPSLFEGFGIPVLEAMACGCPVVCANTTALPEVGGEAVRLFDPLNVPAMAETIRQVWEDADLRAAMARQGLRRAEHYRWERIIPAVVEVYRETFQRFSKGNQHAT
jgi:glycosyltransferase involved in cell wall biosynthesis